MGPAVLSFLLCSSRPFHSEAARQRSTTVLRQWKQGLQQPTDRHVSLYLHINRAQLEWISFLNSPGWRKNPWQSHSYRKSNQQLIHMNFPIVHVLCLWSHVKRCQIYVIWLADCSTIVCVINCFFSRWHILPVLILDDPLQFLKRSLKYSRTSILH